MKQIIFDLIPVDNQKLNRGRIGITNDFISLCLRIFRGHLF